MTLLIHNRNEAISLLGPEQALVPTMGALHEGHLSLVRIAQKHAAKVWVSIFVNPLQFSAGEDFNEYPKTLERDLELLSKLNVDYVFAPNKAEIYDNYPYDSIKADPTLSNQLCGLSRPGHFDGVCTVVKILFDIIQPQYAIFGEKDYQQLKIIQEMVTRYHVATKIIPAPILREANGLAMSSRNQYLNNEQKILAANIYKILDQLSKASDFISAKEKYWQELITLGIEPEYIEKQWTRVFVAARIANTRLIDNKLSERIS